MFETRHLQTFREVVRAGSYSAAARTLGYTQPAITQQMKALERTVGAPLFAKSGRGLRLTEAGEALTRHAELILDNLTVARQQLTALARLRAGRVRICAFPSATSSLVPEATRRLVDGHPDLRVELLEAEPPESLERLMRGECDIALAFSYPGLHTDVPAELVGIPLMEDSMAILLPAGHELARRSSIGLAELAEQRWISGCPRCRTNFLHLCAEQHFTPDIVFTTDDNLAVQGLVAAGVGIALMPDLVFSFLRHPKVIQRPMRPLTRRAVSAYVLREHLEIPSTALLLEELKTVASARSQG